MKNKKYFWLKLNKDFFKQREMKKLRRIAGGDTYTIIYLKMMLLSLNTDGELLYAETENSIVEQISLEIDEQFEDVQLTLSFLQNNNLAEINETSDVSLIEAKELIYSESSSAERVRKHRSKKIEEQKTLPRNTNVTKSNAEIEIDKEKEIKIETDIDKIVEEFRTIIKKYYKNVSTRFGTKVAKDKIKVAIKKNYNLEEIKRGYENYLIANKHRDIEYIQKFETFMNQESWRDFQERVENNQVKQTNGKRTEIIPVFDSVVDDDLKREYEKILAEMRNE